MSWRIDSKTKSRHVTDMNDLTAIVELNIGTEQTKEKGGQVSIFF